MHNIDKPVTEKTKGEIEQKLSGMGDYVKMSYLQRALKSGLDFETKKFVLLKLATIYYEKKMYLDAAKLVKSAAEITTTYKEKIFAYLKATELHIKGGDYVEADRLFAQALALSNDREKREIKEKYKNYYIAQAKAFITQNRRSHAKAIYEKVLTLDMQMGERAEVQKTLLDLYYKLGNVKEYHALRDKMQK